MTLTTPELIALRRLHYTLWKFVDSHSHYIMYEPIRSDDVRDAEELLTILDKVIAAADKP